MRQTIWGPLAVVNFTLGGMGAGAYVLAAALSGFSLIPPLTHVRLVGPLVVVAGFLAVAVEAGRPLRGLNVLLMVHRSWMSRELWAGLAFVLLASEDLLWPALSLRLVASLAALLFILSQGCILFRARGVAAWNVRPMPVLFLTSGLLTGAGLLGFFRFFGIAGGGEALLLWTMVGLIVVNGALWMSLLTWAGDEAFRDSTGALRSGGAWAGILGVGHLLPLLLLGALRYPALPLAGLTVLIGGVLLKALLILGAGQFRAIAIDAIEGSPPVYPRTQGESGFLHESGKAAPSPPDGGRLGQGRR